MAAEPTVSVMSLWTLHLSVLGKRLSCTVVAVTGSAPPGGCLPSHLPSCCADLEAGVAGRSLCAPGLILPQSAWFSPLWLLAETVPVMSEDV